MPGFKACDATETAALSGLEETNRYSRPCLWAEAERTRSAAGAVVAIYGIEPNRVTPQAFLRYHHEQALSPRQYMPEEIFAPDTLLSSDPSAEGRQRRSDYADAVPQLKSVTIHVCFLVSRYIEAA